MQVVSTSLINESKFMDEDEESKEEDAKDRMYEEDNINNSLLAPADEDYEMDPSLPLGNLYTQLTFSESSPHNISKLLGSV